MNNQLSVNLIQHEKVSEVAAAGVKLAAGFLRSEHGLEVEGKVPRAVMFEAHDLKAVWNQADEQTLAIWTPIEGHMSGQIVFLCPFSSAQTICEMLYGEKPKDLNDLGERQMDAVWEIGNHVNAAFLAAVAEKSGLRSFSTPSMLTIDTAQATLKPLAKANEIGLMFQTVFIKEDLEFDGGFVFIPEDGALREFLFSIGVMEAA